MDIQCYSYPQINSEKYHVKSNVYLLSHVTHGYFHHKAAMS